MDVLCVVYGQLHLQLRCLHGQQVRLLMNIRRHATLDRFPRVVSVSLMLERHSSPHITLISRRLLQLHGLRRPERS